MDLSDAVLQRVSVHYVGNKGNGDELITSKAPLELRDDERIIMRSAFLSRFNLESERYAFNHLVSLDYNEVYNYCLNTLAETETFQQNAINIAKCLHEATEHPKIKAGDLYICYFENCEVEGAFVDAIGIFKTETKNNFLDLELGENKEFKFELRVGVDAAKFDKGCLVFPTNAENGFDVLLFDSANKGEEAVFWRETFLNVLPQATAYFQTNQFLTLTKQFIAKQLPEEREITKTDQIDLLNKTVEYFRGNESFDKKQFEEEVFHDPAVISAFRNFETTYAEAKDIEVADNFDISLQAVKKQAKVFKSVLKLDKNFHVYIHGDKSLIEKGFDPVTGKHFYKIYFDEEE